MEDERQSKQVGKRRHRVVLLPFVWRVMFRSTAICEVPRLALPESSGGLHFSAL